MQFKEIARRLQGRAANIALRMPISWVHLAAGLPIVVDGRTLDSRTQWFLKLLAMSGQRPLSMLGVARARAEVDIFMAVMGGRPAPVGEIIDRTIPGPAGPMRVRLYRPAGTVARLLPTILFFHGGGFVLGSLESYDLACRFLCAQSGCALISVDYRLAPENKFPAAIEDGLAAFRWLAEEGAALGLDPARIVLAGESAGGTIAAVIARETRDAPQKPYLQWLIYPALDFEEERASHLHFGDRFLITRADLEWFRELYLDGLDQIGDPRVSPMRAPDLAGVPPALIFTAGFDPLRDEGRVYAERLTEAGVRSVHHEFDSLVHGFVCMRGALPAAARAMDDMVNDLRQELARLGR